ncbi:hypothetical protein [Rubinisphaera sp.]|uniref:hypothetical protein n=1 Tax=Rubinisphaera sp. TaxID=2024857 RepID=UPI000C0FE843|nr:hypothetical protein [Rubinisphaera sp.]MBV08669.1 hypothetical protein [Rubinisphaera sp.]HCS49998.1 hypothetical protein [Planctomycetaceae bacterium]|tara:strand:+ start:5545 stop:6918 length:1374 start_codon:yes stop_codon:yes gene_type:complete
MNQLHIALQGFESLAPGLNLNLNAELSDSIEQWLTTEVCPVVDELGQSKRFQTTVLWSVNHLSPSANTDERRLVVEVERKLVDLAAEIATFIDVAEKEAPPGDQKVSEFADLHRETAEFVANKPWFDLVCTQDFFHPTQDLHLDTAKLNYEHTKTFRERNIQLPLGDYVTRLLLNRVDYWASVLRRIADAASSLVPVGPGKSERFKAMSRVQSRRIDLDHAVEKMISICNEPKKQRQREAATALTLVYAAYSNNPRLDWLSGDDSWWKVGGSIIRSWIRRRGTMQNQVRDSSGVIVLTPPVQESLCDPSIIRHLAYSLQEMKHFFAVDDDPLEIIDDAVNRAKLVMVDREPREVWFNGRPACDAIWDNQVASWDLLWKLAMKPRHAVDHEALSKCTVKTFRSRRNRLGELLGEESGLNGIIETLPRLGYKLQIDPNSIILLQDDGFGNLKELSSSSK